MSDDNRHYFDTSKNVEQRFFEQTYTLHYRSYLMGNQPDGLPLHYEGGVQSYSYWLSRADIERVLLSLGFTSFRVHRVGELSGMLSIGLLAERG